MTSQSFSNPNILGLIFINFCHNFSGSDIFGIDYGVPETSSPHTPPSEHFTMIFNTFVMMTLFNEVNARKIHEQRNVIEGLQRNPVFIGIWLATVVAQVSLQDFKLVEYCYYFLFILFCFVSSF